MDETDKMTLNAFEANGIVVPEGQKVEISTEQPFIIGNGTDDGLQKDRKYPLRADGRIDWDKLINPRYLIYPNGDKTKEPRARADGLRDVVEVRGILAKEVTTVAITPQFVQVKVKILLKPNRDDPEGRLWETSVDATPDNVFGKFGHFLTACADTRAMARCIKEALGIRILVQEELSGAPDEGMAPSSPDLVSDAVLVAIERQRAIKGVTEEALMKGIIEKYPNIKFLRELTTDQAAKVLNSLNAKQNPKTEA